MGAPSSIAIRNGDDRDATSKPIGACAAVGGPSLDEAAVPTAVPTALARVAAVVPNRGQGPRRERAVPTTPLASAVADEPSPDQVPNRDRLGVPTTELASGGPTARWPGQDRGQSASLPQSQSDELR